MPRAKAVPSTHRALALCAIFAFGAAACGGCGGNNDNGEPNGQNVDVGVDSDTETDAEGGAPDVDGSDASGDDMDMAGEMGPPPSDPVGQLNVTYRQPDVQDDGPALHTQAVFSPELAASGILNPVGWLSRTQSWDVFRPQGYWLIPGAEPTPDVPGDVAMFDTLDAGAFVASGDVLRAERRAELLASNDVHVYASLLEASGTYAAEADLSSPMNLHVAGGDEVSSAEVPEAFTVPRPIEVTNVDPRFHLPVRYGEELVVEWEPSVDPDDYLVVGLQAFGGGMYWRVADADGGASLDALAASVNRPVGDEPTVSLSRIREEDVQLSEGVLQVVSQRRQWLYGERVGPFEVEPQIWPVGESTTVRVAWWDGEFAASDVDAGPDVTVENARIADAVGHVIEFDATIGPDAATGTVDLTFGDDLTIPRAAWVAAPLPNAGDCASAVAGGFVTDGTYHGTDEGLDADTFSGTESCPLMNPGGREQAVPIQLQAGQVLEATLARSDLNGVLYIAKGCDDADDVRLCTMAPRKGRAARLEYVALQDEEILLVVDGYATSDAPPASYVLDIRTTPPRPFDVSPTAITDGGLETLSVQSFVGEFDGSSTFDFGPDITVENVDLSGDTALVDVSAGDGSGSFVDSTPDVTLEIDGIDHTVSDLMTIRRFIGANQTCPAADAAGALSTGVYEGLTLLGVSDEVTPVPCLPATADGQEGIFRVDLGPSETLRATVDMPGHDPVIYVVESCGGEVLACADAGADNFAEYVEWTGPAEPSTVYLVVDGFAPDDSDIFYLDLDVSL